MNESETIDTHGIFKHIKGIVTAFPAPADTDSADQTPSQELGTRLFGSVRLTGETLELRQSHRSAL